VGDGGREQARGCSEREPRHGVSPRSFGLGMRSRLFASKQRSAAKSATFLDRAPGGPGQASVADHLSGFCSAGGVRQVPCLFWRAGMRRTAMLWEVFVTRFQEAFEQYEKHRLSSEEAGELLGMSGRNFRRLCVRYEEDGIEGLRDRRLGKVSPRRAPAGELERMQALYRGGYGDFTVKHFHEQLGKRHGYKLCYTVTKASLQAAGVGGKGQR